MRTRIWLSALLGVFLFCSSGLADELTPEKAADIRRMIEITGAMNMAKQFAAASAESLFQTLKAVKPDIPNRAFPILQREVETVFSEKNFARGGLMDRIVSVYHSYFTHQEIRELLTFYQTPVGVKTIQVMPKMTQDFMTVGEQWVKSQSSEIDARVTAAFKREGITIK